MPVPDDYEIYEIPDFTLECGATLRPARIAYTTYGTLNADKTNAIVYPTWYSGRHWDNEWLIGSDLALDPANWFIIVPNMLGNGLSSSPSNTPPPPAGTITVCTPRWGGLVMSAFTQARSKIVPTTWKSVSMLGPASTT